MLVVRATVVVVATVGHGFLGLTWPMAFASGAIVSPTDALAATAIVRRLGVTADGSSSSAPS